MIFGDALAPLMAAMVIRYMSCRGADSAQSLDKQLGLSLEPSLSPVPVYPAAIYDAAGCGARPPAV
jgi:hypothetical protein